MGSWCTVRKWLKLPPSVDNFLKVPVLSMDGKSHRVFLGTQSCWFNIEVTGKNAANTNHRGDMWGEWVEIRAYM